MGSCQSWFDRGIGASPATAVGASPHSPDLELSSLGSALRKTPPRPTGGGPAASAGSRSAGWPGLCQSWFSREGSQAKLVKPAKFANEARKQTRKQSCMHVMEARMVC